MGKLALVTGAGAGIGRAAAMAFAKTGAKTVVADIADRQGLETVAMIEEAGGEAGFVHRCGFFHFRGDGRPGCGNVWPDRLCLQQRRNRQSDLHRRWRILTRTSGTG